MGLGVGGEHEKGVRGKFGGEACYMGEDEGRVEGKDGG